VKCSKCGYLGFEAGDRCRNCGYEFSLAESFAFPDLPLRRDGLAHEEPREGEDDDLALIDAAAAGRTTAMTPRMASDPDRTMGESRGARGRRSPSALSMASAPNVATATTTAGTVPPLPMDGEPELLLFGQPFEDDLPLITKPSPPRPPLSVRRSTPEVPRLRTVAPRSANLDLGLEPDARLAEPPRSTSSEHGRLQESDPTGEDAGVFLRALASVVDSAVLLAIDAAVVYLTMQICGLTAAELGLLPKGPLVAFLVVQNLGYLVVFTAGGQTLGKMATGIKVVTSDPLESLDVACALKRTVAWLVLVCTGGLGLLSALFSENHRGLHDIFAGTRVVRTSA
jgi:uncharacterized RDD family membrane protein YckC